MGIYVTCTWTFNDLHFWLGFSNNMINSSTSLFPLLHQSIYLSISIYVIHYFVVSAETLDIKTTVSFNISFFRKCPFHFFLTFSFYTTWTINTTKYKFKGSLSSFSEFSVTSQSSSVNKTRSDIIIWPKCGSYLI